MDARRALGRAHNQWLAVFLGSFLLSACGGGGGISAPSGLSYQTPQTATVGRAISPISPAVTGKVDSYSINPALPVGLAISAVTGAISGTPAAVTAQASYTVTATNSGGSTSAVLAIAVNDIKPGGVSYGSTVALAKGVTIAPLTPAIGSGGGAVVSWSISPQLPAGLSLSTTDGSIAGTPTSDSAATSYTVTATNTGGQSTTAFTLSVREGTLVDIGHADEINLLRFDGTHVLSTDLPGHWVLWNYATGAAIARGDAMCTVSWSANPCLAPQYPLDSGDLAGPVFAIRAGPGLELYSVVDGHRVATVDAASLGHKALDWWKLASDGSYIAAGNGAGLQVWSAGGQSLFTVAGDYTSAHVFAAPGELRIAGGAAGSSVIEAITVPTGTSAVSPSFQGAFKTWFLDGGRFLTAPTATTLLTYSSGAVQQDATTVTSPAGNPVAVGGWFANPTLTTLDVYKVGASTAAAASYSFHGPGIDSVMASGTTFGIVSQQSTSVIDLSGAAPVKTDHPAVASMSTNLAHVPVAPYAATSAAKWLVANQFGVILDGAGLPATTRYLSLGTPWSISGSTSRIAVATASGQVLLYDASSLTPLGIVASFTSKVLLSSDGNVLIVLGDMIGAASRSNPAVKAYALPAQTVLNSWAPGGGQYFQDISLGISGTVLGIGVGTVGLGQSDNTASVYQLSGGGPIWSGPAGVAIISPPVSISPDGSWLAAAQAPSGATSGTNLYHGGSLVTAFDGAALGWLDGGHILANNFEYTYVKALPGPTLYHGASVHDTSGAVTAASTLPELHTVQVLDANTVYGPELNQILPVTGAGTIWVSADPTRRVGAVAGSNVVFSSGAQVLVLPR